MGKAPGLTTTKGNDNTSYCGSTDNDKMRPPYVLYRSYRPGPCHLCRGERAGQTAGHRFDWVQGPVWFGDANCLLFSGIPNNRILRWTPQVGISTYRAPPNYANGHTRDQKGRLISCEHGTRRVTRTEHNGSITAIADRFDVRPLNSPNDVVVKSYGSIWFSDTH